MFDLSLIDELHVLRRQKRAETFQTEGKAFPEAGMILCQSVGCPRDTGDQGWTLHRDWGQTWETLNAIRRDFDFTWLVVGECSPLSGGEESLAPVINLPLFSESFP